MTRKRLIVISALALLLGCTDAYQERTTPENCACGDWYAPSDTERTIA